MPEITVIAHNIRSAHNVGAIFRTAEGFGVSNIILSGYTPAPSYEGDPRLPHIRNKLTDQIHKTALGAEALVPFEYQEQPDLAKLKSSGYTIVALEQTPTAHMLPNYRLPQKIALLLGEEVHGIPRELLELCDESIEIPMVGKKE
ncbi:MAG TPA: TrmH family RNA methyltransferase, partial [Candidatus Saccharimonadales bacterium]